MTLQPLPQRDSDGLEEPQWKPPLAALQQALQDATRAVAELWVSLEEMQPAPAELSSEAADEPARAALHVPLDWTPDAGATAEPASAPVSEGVPQEQLPMPDQLSGEQKKELKPEKSERLADFQRVWARIERQRSEQDEPAAADPAPEAGKAGDGARGLNLLPSEYVITVEDRDASVDLITIERALLTLAKMEDVTLVSYAKGVPVISLRLEGELDLTALGDAVGSAMDKRCEVIPQ